MAAPSPTRRVRAIGAHLAAGRTQTPPALAACSRSAALPVRGVGADGGSPPKVLLTDDEVKSFLINGWHILPGPRIGLPDALHDSIYDEGLSVLAAASGGESGQLVAENVTSRIPQMQEICASPVVSGAIQSLLGEGYALHPHTFLHSTFPGNDQDVSVLLLPMLHAACRASVLCCVF